MAPEATATPISTARERVAAAVRCLVLFTVVVMMRLPGARDQGLPLDVWSAIAACYLLASTFAPARWRLSRNDSLCITGLDVVLITSLLYLTGGMRSEYYLLYYLPVLHASVRLNFRDGVGASTLAGLCYIFVGIAHPHAEIETNPVWRMVAFGTSALILGSLFSLAAREAGRLRQARDHYQKMSEERRDLMAVMAHEFRNPMTSIAGFSQLLAENRLDTDQQREYASIIHDQCLRLNRLLSGLVELSRVEAGKMEPKRRAVPLRELLVAAVGAVQAGDRKLHVDFSVTPGNLEAYIDPDMTLQVLYNLLGNAAKYAGPDPRVSISAALAHGALGMIRIDLQDNGPGIPQEELPHIFDRFYRCRAAASAKAEGSGLGLAICKAIVQAHGGDITASSPPGRGATFSFTLPAFDPAETGEVAPRAPSDSREESRAPAQCR